MFSISKLFNKSLDDYKYLLPLSNSNNKYLFEINRNNKSVVFTSIYKHKTLSDLHANIFQVLFPMSDQSIEMIELKTHSHENYLSTNTNTNTNKKINNSKIRDIFLFNTKNNKILSIPLDNNMTLIEFIDANQEYFTSLYSRPFPEIYQIYVIDHDFVIQKPFKV